MSDAQARTFKRMVFYHSTLIPCITLAVWLGLRAKPMKKKNLYCPGVTEMIEKLLELTSNVSKVDGMSKNKN